MAVKLTDDELRAMLNKMIRSAKRGPRASCMKCEGLGFIVTDKGVWKQIGMGPCECLNVDSKNLPKGTPYV